MSDRRSSLAGTVAGALFGGGLLVLLLGTLWLGADYYAVARVDRHDHALHGLLAAGGPGGVALGLLGTALMVGMLLYTARKAMTRAGWLGPLSGWLHFHIICGVMGPLFILLHAGALMPRGLIALGFWCMVLVALSGTFGRYVFSFFPRTASGRVLRYASALEEIADLKAELVERTAADRSESIAKAVALATDFEMDPMGLADLVRLRREVRRRRRHIDLHLQATGLDRASRAGARDLLHAQLRMKSGLASWQVAGRLLRYWHLFHRPLAGAMYAVIVIHVTVAVLFGGSLYRLPELWR